MEFCASLMKNGLKLKILFLIMLLNLQIPDSAAAAGVVLITHEDSQLSELSSLDIRKLYLGFKVFKNEKNLRPILNVGERDLLKVFLHDYLSLSERGYRRKLMAGSFRKPIAMPQELGDLKAVQSAMSRESSVVFIWEHDLPLYKNVKQVGVR